MAAAPPTSVSNARNGSTTAAFNGKDVSTYFKNSWSHVLERSNDSKMPVAEKPEIFKAPGGPGGAWGSGGGAWGGRPGNQTTIFDGQQFTVALSKALQQQKQPEKKP